jgi:predicted acyltransferase
MVGFACFIIAYFWNFGFPINKKLWTSSFVLHTTGLTCMLLSVVIYLLDFRRINFSVYFFQVFGRNPLVLYMLSMFCALLVMMIPFHGTTLQNWLYENIFATVGAKFGSLLYAISYMLLCWLVGYVLDRRKIYIKV